jgi:hypothetical protein
MPTENCLWLDQHPDQGRPVHSLAQRGHDRPIRRFQLRPLDLAAHHSKLVAEEKQFRFRVVDSQPHVSQVEEQPKPGVRESEEHRRSNPIGQATLLRVACPPMNM